MKWNKTSMYVVGSVIVTSVVGLGLYLLKKKKKPTDKFGNEWLLESSGLQGGIESQRQPQGSGLIEPDWSNPFHSSFKDDVVKWVAPRKIIKLTSPVAHKIAKEIREAKGRWWISNDDEQAIKNIFTKKLKDKVQVANVAESFFIHYRDDLESYLKSFLNASEMKKYVYEPIAQLKNYRETT